jgi:outer membrane protein assembly factor BamB
MGTAEYNGQTGRMSIEFFEHEKAGLVARFGIPDLQAWEVAMMRVAEDGDQVKIGTWTIERQEDGTLAGLLPDFFVPAEIPVVFRRVQTLDKVGLPSIDVPMPEPVWTRDLGHEVWAGMAVDNGSLFVGSDSGQLLALDASTGETRWEFMTQGDIRARPTVDGDRVYVHSDDGHLYALEVSGGKELWRAETAPTKRIKHGEENSRYNYFSSAAAVSENGIYVGGFDGCVVALDVASGDERWRFKAEDTVAGTPAVTDGRVFFGSFDGHIYAVDATTGDEIWRFDTGQAVTTEPLVRDGLVVIGSRNYNVYALDAATGKPRWKHHLWFSWAESSAAEHDGVVYFGASDSRTVSAVELATGRLVWQFDSLGVSWPQPAITEDRVFAASLGSAGYWADHRAGFFALDRNTGQPIWRLSMERPGESTQWGFAAAPAADDSRVFTADLSGRVYAFRQ